MRITDIRHGDVYFEHNEEQCRYNIEWWTLYDQNSNLVFSIKAYNILNIISDIGIDDPTGYPEYREDYIDERYAEILCK